MSTPGATRMNLLARREQSRIAGDGARLLRSKRDALMKEFLAAADTVLSSRSELEERCREASAALHRASSHEGPEAVRSAAMAASRSLPLEVSERRVWGIPLPQFSFRELVRSPEARGYGLAGTGVPIDETASAFEKVLEQGLASAMEEVRLRRIGEEIRRTSRRVNALEQILIPSLAREIARIARLLEERAREDLFRLKRLKDGRGRRAAAKRRGTTPG